MKLSLAHLKVSCYRFFLAWIELLDGAPGRWVVRHVPDGLVWRSLGLRELYGVRSEPMRHWEERVRYINEPSVLKVEHYHSLALKTGKAYSFTYQARLQSHQSTTLAAAVVARRCSNCSRHCALIIGRVWCPGDPGATPSEV